jgi:hypothetical protein
MLPEIEELAENIANLDPKIQENLLEKVTELNFQRGLNNLMKKYQQRLKNEKEFEQNSKKILEKLKQIRAEVAAEDYPGEDE